MKKFLLTLTYLSFSLVFISGCGSKVNIGTDESDQFEVFSMTSDVDFTTLSKFILTPYCIKCHSWAQNEALVQQRIVLGNPEESILYQKIKTGEMPTDRALSTKQLNIVERYIKNPNTIPAEVIRLTPTYQSLKFHLFERSCNGCHNDERHAGRISLTNFKVVQKKAKRILELLEDRETEIKPMPPVNKETGIPKAPIPSQKVIEALRQWIRDGKKDN